MLGRTGEAKKLLAEMGSRRLSPILDILVKGFGALLEKRPEAMTILDAALVQHKDPEALFMIGMCQAYARDPRALESLGSAVDGGYTVPDALRTNLWLADLKREGKLDTLIDRAEAGRREALRVFGEYRGQDLLGPI